MKTLILFLALTASAQPLCSPVPAPTVLHIATSSHNVVLTWNTQPYRCYEVEYTTNLDRTIKWSSLGDQRSPFVMKNEGGNRFFRLAIK